MCVCVRMSILWVLRLLVLNPAAGCCRRSSQQSVGSNWGRTVCPRATESAHLTNLRNAGVLARKQNNTRPNSAEEKQWKHWACTPEDCFWPVKPCFRKHKPTFITCVYWNIWIFFSPSACNGVAWQILFHIFSVMLIFPSIYLLQWHIIPSSTLCIW